jgi:hypothetical protein
MQKMSKQEILKCIYIVLLVALAYTCRKISGRCDGFWSTSLTLLRNMIYIGMVIAWAVSVKKRILQSFVRSHLLCCGGLMIFWLVVRTSRYLFLDGHDVALRYCWYGYYLPMLLIPLMAIFVAVSIGKPENFALPKWQKLMYLPSAILFLIVLTNDLHQLVFVFPNGVLGNGSGKYSYGPLYYVIMAWIFAEILYFLIALWYKCRIPGSRKRLFAPFVPFLFLFAYATCYAVSISLTGHFSSDLTAVVCLLVMAICEFSISVGLIRSNTHYKELFCESALHAQIADSDFKPFLASGDTNELSVEIMQSAKNAPVLLENGTRVSLAPISGGYCLWEEDVSELLAVLAKLQENQEDLKNANLITEANYKKERAIRALREKNRLYDKMQRLTASQLIMQNRMLKEYIKTDDEATKRRLLGKLVVVGTFIKRKNNLIFTGEQNGQISVEELEQCFAESTKAIRLYGAESHYYINLKKPVYADSALAFYDFFENVTETGLDTLKSILVRLIDTGGTPTLYIDVSCDADLSGICTNGVTMDTDEPDVCSLRFQLPEWREAT